MIRLAIFITSLAVIVILSPSSWRWVNVGEIPFSFVSSLVFARQYLDL